MRQQSKAKRAKLIKEADALVKGVQTCFDINQVLADLFDAVNCYTYAGMTHNAQYVKEHAEFVLAEARKNRPELDPIWKEAERGQSLVEFALALVIVVVIGYALGILANSLPSLYAMLGK